MHLAIGVLLTTIALAAPGCGAGDVTSHEATAAHRPAAAPEGRFAERAEAVCDHAEQRIARLVGGRHSVGVATLAAAVAVERQTVELLAAIPAPRTMRAPYGHLRDAIARRAQLRQRFLTALHRSGHMSQEIVHRANVETVKANRLAERLSLRSCPPF